ncbi:ABC transporter permease [Gryllotalpicola protaetiae]|uniref:ABC transporter permease subunit n=1 Tax=Gryllotalpicola protaetiae TaxID=2419771 RepID=A0A387BQJ9_9MICO|nr:ABC transporter permease subunit [Gryllotalpicola protaetiae]AYG03277.1 ABC transporter permease subunit [Gryllotalpicola protaetiae]
MPVVARRVLYAFGGILLLAALWELYKAVGPADGVHWGQTVVLPRTSDLAMPHLWSMFQRYGQPVDSSAGSPTVLSAVLRASLISLGIAACGWAAGVILGALLALLMVSWRLAERAILPFVILSQTVPLIALAPLVVTWGSQIHAGDFVWKQWMSVAAIAGYLAFFPISVGLLRGLRSAPATQLELFRSFAAGWWRTLWHLRLPAAVTYLLPALRVAAAAAVVGAIVAEVSTGMQGGIGRTILAYGIASGGDPAKPWDAIIGAVAVGLVVAGLVSLIGLGLGRFRRTEESA